ncbi:MULTISPECIES: cell division protein FtsQ/DivIB [Bacillaceae]|uniref:cell division protein FtsQ/DivIB n=1 Tax=Bacillaceae TaxID=186817 RepID=UPI001C571AF1|nr:FtsQ-type POTRA domain-containing protein [Rossellomorea sp. YZS02]MBW3113961.1 FtsQ-type POTRA domain-containing protein [Bacillus sp. MCCB 382]MDX8343008.1 FtsQ-type POTRA domain-containing protein [Rossellomorea sp. YZS02]
MKKENVVSIEDRIPKLKQHRKKKANRRLMLLLSLFFLMILSVVYFQSPLSHVKTVDVNGNELISNKKVLQESGIDSGMNVWSVNKDKTVEQLKKLPEVKDAKVELTFPNSYEITIHEYDKKAYLSKGNKFFVILSNGKVLDKGTGAVPVDAPLLRGFEEDKVLVKMVKELGELPDEVQHLISEINLVPKKTDQYHLTLFMNDGFEVSATIRSFSEKMVHYPSIVSQLDPEVKGVIDLEVGSYFRAYETEGEQSNEEDEGER